MKKLFNLHHVSLQDVMKHVFEIFKQHFQIYNHTQDEYSILIQTKLIFALTVIHNFINKHEEDISLEKKEKENIKANKNVAEISTEDNVNQRIKQDKITKNM